MKFMRMLLTEAEGALLAHSIRTPQGAFKKGRVLSREDILALQAAGLEKVVAARLDAGETVRTAGQLPSPVQRDVQRPAVRRAGGRGGPHRRPRRV